MLCIQICLNFLCTIYYLIWLWIYIAFTKSYSRQQHTQTVTSHRDHFVFAPSQWEKTSSLIGWVHTQNGPCIPFVFFHKKFHFFSIQQTCDITRISWDLIKGWRQKSKKLTYLSWNTESALSSLSHLTFTLTCDLKVKPDQIKEELFPILSIVINGDLLGDQGLHCFTLWPPHNSRDWATQIHR